MYIYIVGKIHSQYKSVLDPVQGCALRNILGVYMYIVGSALNL